MRIVIHRILPLLLITLCTTVGQTPLVARGDTSAYLALDVAPTSAPVGSVVTLHITYKGLGLPNTTIVIEPSEALRFDPPRSMPCKYDHDPTGCTEITFRTQTYGEVTIRATADGEIFDPVCGCWRWTYERASAVLTITGSRLWLPVVQR